MNSISKSFAQPVTRGVRYLVLVSFLITLGLSPLALGDTHHIADDAYIDLGSPSSNSGSVPSLAVSNIITKKSGEKQAFISYELLALPDEVSLEQAYLRLFVDKVHTGGVVDIYLVTEPWDEENINGINAPATELLPFADFVLSDEDEGHFVIIDVTPEVQMWLDGTADNHGFVLVGNPSADVEVSFDSKENSQTSHQSELELVLGVADGGVDSGDIADGSVTSDDVADETITTDDIADGSVTSDDIADGSISGTDILDGSIGASDVDIDGIQLRVNGTCAAGSSIRVIDNTGGVTCEPDDDSGGDITAVSPSAGGGLAGGADSGDAELGIAAGGVNSGMIADGTINSNDVDDSSVQLRVGSTCPAGSAIRAIASDGSVVCQTDGDSGGDITSVQPSAAGGLTGGADSGDAVLGVAAGGITSAMIADGGILGTDVKNTEVQLRVTTQCAPGSSIRSINATGTATCEIDNFEANTDTTLDPDLFWKVAGNAGTSPIPGGSNLLGTTDDTELVLAAYGEQTMRLSFIPDANGGAVNLLGGHSVNRIVNAIGATVGGGGYTVYPNKAESNFSTISGGLNNGILGTQGTIGGGRSNLVLDGNGTIGGGIGNHVEGAASTVSGGNGNATYASNGTIGGGLDNHVDGTASTVSGGDGNEIYRSYATIGGGFSNSICDPEIFPDEDYDVNAGRSAVIAGGASNRSCGSRSFIGSGFANLARGPSSMIIGGAWNRTWGRYSIAAGHFSEAHEDWSVALGEFAIALHEGAFVWSDAYSISDFESQRDNQFRIGAVGGARFDLGDDGNTIPAGNQWVDLRAQGSGTLGNNPAAFRVIDTSTGAYLSLGGGWVNSSDRNRKADFGEVDVQQVLEQVVSMPIQSWRYKVEGEQVRHIGPMAQDFHAVFGLGGDPKGIMSVDADGVALAAIQALYQLTRELEQRTLELEVQNERIESLEAAFEELRTQLAPFAPWQQFTELSTIKGSD